MATKRWVLLVVGTATLIGGHLTSQAFPIIRNPSFEDSTISVNPGYGTFQDWTLGGVAGGGGVNPTTDGSHPFWDNGQLVDGKQVAFLQNGAPTTMSQLVDGFKAGRGYVVTYYYNVRVLQNPTPPVATVVSVTLGGQVIDPDHTVTAVEGHQSYNSPFHKRVTSRFVAPSDGAFDLVFSSRIAAPGYPDYTTLFDYITIAQDPPEENLPPLLDPIPDQRTYAGREIRFTATASDSNQEPVQRLTFSLEGEIPEGATMDPDTGNFEWLFTPETPFVFPVTVKVTDSGVPAKSHSQVVRLTLLAGPELRISREGIHPKIEWDSLNDFTYRLVYKDRLEDLTLPWIPFPDTFRSDTGTISYRDESEPSPSRFYRLE